MRQPTFLFAGFLLLAAAALGAADTRVSLLPRLQPGQVLTYWIYFHGEKIVKTESHVATPMAPDSAQTDANGLLRIEIKQVQTANSKPTIHAIARFLSPDAAARNDPAAGKPSDGNPPATNSAAPSVEFTISQDGFAQGINGANSLTPEQQQVWEQWLARFTAAWALPPAAAKIGEKWKLDQPEPAASPIAGLYWARETEYVRNEPCRASALSPAGDVSPSSGPASTCAVLLTTAALKQKSSPNDATPEDFKLHSLRTSGTAGGTTEIISYISLETGLIVRASEDTGQFMDVVVSKADASNRIHYNVDAKSRAEVLLLEPTPSSHR